jgi:hypothetical protein
MDFELGQPITFKSKLVRCYGTRTINGRQHYRIKYWDEQRLSQQQTGFIIGIRTLSNGRKEWEDSISVYTPLEHFKALLIVRRLSSKPFFIPMP